MYVHITEIRVHVGDLSPHLPPPHPGACLTWRKEEGKEQGKSGRC